MELKKASWDLVPQILKILREKLPETKTSYNTLNGYDELRQKYKEEQCELLTPNATVDDYATFVLLFPRYAGNLFFETLNPDLEPLTSAIANLPGIDWTGPIFLMTISGRLYPVVDSLAEKFGIRFGATKTTSYHLSNAKARALTCELPDDVYIDDLEEEHAERINSIWPHGNGDETLPRMKENIRNRKNVGVFRKADNLLMAWCFHLEYGGSGILMEAEEGKGYKELALTALAKRLGVLGLDPVGFAVDEANAQLFEKLGYEPGYLNAWFFKI